MITASIVTYNNNLLDLEAVLRSILISPVQKLWIIDHSDVFTRLEGELNEYMRRDEEFRKHISRGFVLKYIKHVNNGYGGGHNVAIREAIAEGSEYHLVLNPDVWFGPEVVPAIWKKMESDRSIAKGSVSQRGDTACRKASAKPAGSDRPLLFPTFYDKEKE